MRRDALHYSTGPRGPNEQGSTLADLAVGMLVSALVLGAVYAAYLFAAESIGAWRGRQAMANAHYALERRIAEDVRQAAALVSLQDGFALLGTQGDTLAVYRAQNGSLTRNGRMSHSDVHLSGLTATAADDGMVQVELVVEGVQKSQRGRMRRISSRLRSFPLATWFADANSVSAP